MSADTSRCCQFARRPGQPVDRFEFPDVGDFARLNDLPAGSFVIVYALGSDACAS